MPDLDTVSRHLRQLETYVGRLRELQKHPRHDVLTDWQTQAMVDRYLQLGIEVVISVSQQLIAILDLPIPDSNRGAVQALVNAEVLSEELGNELSRAVGFRNVIVHGYMDIDYHIVYEVLQSDVRHLERFVTQVATFVEGRLPSKGQE
jgi:uncharacterized protein YutE (UPF0331/DUF86 family)